jgi:cell division protein FtsW
MSEVEEKAKPAPSSRAASRRPGMDITLLATVSLILGVGLVMVASASIEIASQQQSSPFFYFTRQMAYALVGVGIMVTLYRVRLAYWENYGVWLLLGGLALLALVLVPGLGRNVNGATRWIGFGPINFQVSELVKILTIVYLAGYMVRRGTEVRERLSGFLKPFTLLLMAAGLMLLEPDFGATVLLMGTAMIMLFMGGVRSIQFAVLAGLALAGMAGLAVLSPYRMARLTAFMNPWADPYNTGFQLTQSLIAIGSGGLTGLGLGGSVQKLSYLPEAHTDFLFAVIAEELGLLGVIAVIALYGTLVWRCYSLGNSAHVRGLHFSAYVAYGIGAWMGLQAVINMAVNMGALPTKGLTLPLMSFGGSSMLSACTGIGLLLRIQRETREAGNLPMHSRVMSSGAVRL